MAPELEKKIAQVVGRSVHIHLKTYMEFPEEPQPIKPQLEFKMSAETKAKILMAAEQIMDKKIRHIMEKIASR